jgi:hypothetical protein
MGGGGAKSYDRKKAWSSINHSKLSGHIALKLRMKRGNRPSPYFLSLLYSTLPAFSCQPVFAKIAQLKYICQIGRFFALSFSRISHVTLGAERRLELSIAMSAFPKSKEHSFKMLLSETL